MAKSQQDLNLQLAAYVGQLPESRQTLHHWMQRLEVAALGIVVALFVLALYISFQWATLGGKAVFAAWMVFAFSLTLPFIVVGLHAVVLEAFPPIVLPGRTGTVEKAFPPIILQGRSREFVTGRRAVFAGWGLVVTMLAGAVIWGVFAYATLAENMGLLTTWLNIFGVLVGVVAVVAVVSALYQQFRPR